jgi:flagellar motor switch protein FliN/FliY
MNDQNQQGMPGQEIAAHRDEMPKRPINFLFDIPIELTVEVGKRKMTMGELVEVMPGTVVELDRPAGDNLDIVANGKLIARGEAVLVGERYGVRIMEVIGEDPFAQATAEEVKGE